MELSSELAQLRAGILCITPDNVLAPWLHFEAGALSRTIERSYVCPFLLRLRPADLPWPLAMFQATVAEEADVARLMATLNRALGGAALPEKQLEKAFATYWPELSANLEALAVPAGDITPRAEREILEEVLALVRAMSRERGDRASPMKAESRGVDDGNVVARDTSPAKTEGPLQGAGEEAGSSEKA